MTPRQIEHLKKGQWIDTRPCAISADIAHRLFMSGSDAKYYLILWWDELPAGFTQFIFSTDNLDGQSELTILKMNRADTAMDEPGVIDFRSDVLVFGVECDNLPGAIKL